MIDNGSDLVSLLQYLQFRLEIQKNRLYRQSETYGKNGHILPTGQWYAPSAVINDALIMPEYARAFQSMPEYARVCQSMPE